MFVFLFSPFFKSIATEEVFDMFENFAGLIGYAYGPNSEFYQQLNQTLEQGPDNIDKKTRIYGLTYNFKNMGAIYQKESLSIVAFKGTDFLIGLTQVAPFCCFSPANFFKREGQSPEESETKLESFLSGFSPKVHSGSLGVYHSINVINIKNGVFDEAKLGRLGNTIKDILQGGSVLFMGYGQGGALAQLAASDISDLYGSQKESFFSGLISKPKSKISLLMIGSTGALNGRAARILEDQIGKSNIREIRDSQDFFSYAPFLSFQSEEEGESFCLGTYSRPASHRNWGSQFQSYLPNSFSAFVSYLGVQYVGLNYTSCFFDYLCCLCPCANPLPPCSAGACCLTILLVSSNSHRLGHYKSTYN